jgi:branched-chain amino acid transport system permease protein
MTFAGLGAFAMSKVGGGSFLGLLAAIGLAGAVGAVIALPALRLRGLYLALATFAFAVAMDNMFFPTSVAFTFGGSVHINRPGFFGIHLNSDQSFVVFLAVVFAGLCVLLLALRRGPFGRLLLAMKDSEAACATLGLSLTRTKLAVFTLSAAIAGLGGALFGAMATQAGTVDFAAEQSLPILLLAVIGGMATTSGALFGGMSYALVGTKLQALAPSVPNLQFGLTGLAAFGVAFNPDGAVPQMVRAVRGRFSGASGGPVDLAPVPAGAERAAAGASPLAAGPSSGTAPVPSSV